MGQRFLALILAWWVLHFKRQFLKRMRAPGGAVEQGDVPGERGPGPGPAEGRGPGGCSASLPPSLCRGVPREIPQQFWGSDCWKHILTLINLTGDITQC